MKKLLCGVAVLLLIATFNSLSSTAHAQGTAFTYNGKLADNGSPANGGYDLRFTLCTEVTNGSAVGSLTNLVVGVSNGLFAVVLDFGPVFNGSNYWLELAARTNGGGTFTVLNPRQPIMPVPYAIFATTAASANSVAAANISGALSLPQLPSAVLTNNQTDLSVSGSFSGYHTGYGFYLNDLNPMSLDSGFVSSALYFTNTMNSFNGSFSGYHTGYGFYLTDLNPMSLDSGFVSSALYFTNTMNSFNGSFSGYHTGYGFYLTDLNPMSLDSGFVSSALYFTNTMNSFNGSFSGYHTGYGFYLNDLNPMSLDSGFVSSALYFTNTMNAFNGSFSGYHTGYGFYLNDLNPQSLDSGFVSSALYMTNTMNSFNGSFTGYHSGDGNGLVNLSVDAVTGGLTIKLPVLVPGGGTNTLCFTNGILRAIE